MADSAFWLPLVIAIPLLTAIIVFLLPRWSFSLAVAGSILKGIAVLILTVVFVEQGPIRHTIGGWGAPLGIDLVLDSISLLMLLLTTIVGAAITVYAYGYFRSETSDDHKQHQRNFFWPLWLFLIAALNGLFLSGDVFNLYVTLELLGFSAVALTALAGKPKVLKAAMRYLLVSLSGSLLYLMGVVFLYGGFGTLDIANLGTVVTESPALLVAAALITVGLVMKTALFPLHFWLPPAHANAAAPVSALLSALVVKGSFYILLRLWMEVFYPLGDTVVPQLLSVFGAGAVIWGSVQAIMQPRLKLLVAYSTVAQLGYLFLLMPILMADRANLIALAGILCFVLAHAVAKASAFLSAGNILYATNDDRIKSLVGLTRSLPMTFTAFTLAAVSLTALPPSGGFVAKWLMLDTVLDNRYWGIGFVIIGGGLLAAIYNMRVITNFFRQTEKTASADIAATGAMTSLPLAMVVPTISLAVLALLLGFAGGYVLDLLSIGLMESGL